MVWDTLTWNKVSTIEASGNIFNAIYTSDGKYLYTAASSYSDSKSSFDVVEKWDSSSGEKLHEDLWSINHTVAFLPIALSFNDKLLAVTDNISDNEGMIKIWSVSDDRIGISFSLPTAILSLTWSPNGEMLIIGGRDNALHVWDINTLKEIQQIKQLNGSIYSVTYSQDGCYIIGGGNHQSTVIWNAKTWQKVVDLYDITSTEMILNIANSPNNLVAISKAERDNQSTDIWDLSGLLGTKCVIDVA